MSKTSNKSSQIKAIRGMNDLFPDQTITWLKLEDLFKETLEQYGYGQLRTPILEYSNLFSRSIGNVTDIVEKEMYTFADRNDQSLTLRPEGTAGCVRAGIEHGKLYNQTQKWWYNGPMFRYERPQKGRYRQFHQFGVEAFGFNGPSIDIEQIELTARFWKKLGIYNNLRLEINTLGQPESRVKYRKILIEYLLEHKDLLSEQELSRLESNPMRILDSKNPKLIDVIKNAPNLIDYLDKQDIEFFDNFKSQLDNLGIKYIINPHLVRGLDYYTQCVYEWITDDLGAQGTICAGGRYDVLVSQLAGPETPAVGFAIGIERLLLLTETLDTTKKWAKSNKFTFYIINENNNLTNSQKIISDIREQLQDHIIITDHSGGNLNKQFKRAEKFSADFVITINIDINIDINNKILLKPICIKHAQLELNINQINNWLKDNIKK